MKKILLFLFLFPFAVNPQSLLDNFSDGDFTSNPIWLGKTNDFIINTNLQLQLFSSTAGTSYLSTACPGTSIDNMEWQFYISLNFSASNNNLAKVYLVSDNSDLFAPLNGYYLRFGETGAMDAIELNRQTGTTSTLVCRGSEAFIANAFTIRIKVTRTGAGLWNLFVDPTAGFNFIEEATGIDNTHTISNYFGINCQYTTSNMTRFYFDDFYMGPVIIDTIRPFVQNIKILSDTELEVEFTEGVSAPESENILNYSVNNGIGHPVTAERNINNPSLVTLIFSTPFTEGISNILSINNLKDFAGNLMPGSSHYFIYYKIKPYDIIFNELMIDPSPSVGLPEHEYIELFNNTTVTVNIKNWIFSHGNTSRILPDAIIPPDSFLVLCEPSAFANLQKFGNVVPVVSLSGTALTNSGTTICLKDENGNIMHKLEYDDTWYKDKNKSDGGWSLEQMDPLSFCEEKKNWKASIHSSGGTPGSRNSINGKYTDNTAPKIRGACIISENLIEVFFDEAVYGSALNSPSSCFPHFS